MAQPSCATARSKVSPGICLKRRSAHVAVVPRAPQPRHRTSASQSRLVLWGRLGKPCQAAGGEGTSHGRLTPQESTIVDMAPPGQHDRRHGGDGQRRAKVNRMSGLRRPQFPSNPGRPTPLASPSPAREGSTTTVSGRGDTPPIMPAGPPLTVARHAVRRADGVPNTRSPKPSETGSRRRPLESKSATGSQQPERDAHTRLPGFQLSRKPLEATGYSNSERSGRQPRGVTATAHIA